MKIEDCKLGDKVRVARKVVGVHDHEIGLEGIVVPPSEEYSHWRYIGLGEERLAFVPVDSLDLISKASCDTSPVEPLVTQVTTDPPAYETEVSIEHLGYRSLINGATLTIFDRNLNYIEVAIEDIDSLLDTITMSDFAHKHMRGVPCDG